MRLPSTRSLIWQIGVSCALAVAVCTAPASYWGLRTVERAFQRQIADDNQALAEDLARMTAQIPGGRDAVYQRVVGDLHLDRGFACVVDASGHVIANPDPKVAARRPDVRGTPATTLPGGRRSTYANALAAHAGAWLGTLDLGDEAGAQIVASVPIAGSTDRLAVHQRSTFLTQTLRRVRLGLVGLSTLFFLVLSSLCYLFIRRSISGYQVVLAAQAREIARYTDSLEDLVEERTRHLRRAQKELVRQERLAAMGALLQGIAHNLKSPLTGLLGYVELLRADLPDHPDVEGIARTANVLLGFARQLGGPGGGASGTGGGAADCARALQRVATVLEGDMDFRHQLERRIDLPPDLPELAMPQPDLEQVLLNLLQNALDAVRGQRDARIEVRARAPGPGAVVVEVTDNGPGIPPDVRDRIFEPFFTTKPASDDSPSGSGLGLWSVREVVRRAGGTISLHPRASGTGTCFRAVLPAHAGVTGEARRRGSSRAPRGRSR